jgi:NADPH-dependent 2,4-dienoyl-CoA reductase/sulfur reductase-like enzyme
MAATIHRVDDDWNLVPGSEITLKVDAVCLGFGFVPQLELAQLLGCAIEYCEETSDFIVRTDAATRTSRPHVYAAGEVTGLGGVRVAVAEGRLAGLTAAHDAGLLSVKEYGAHLKKLSTRLTRTRRVADWMRRAYRPRAGLWSLAEPSTLLCRCEDVTLASAEAALACNTPTPYAVKTATRAGMGLCQGRICNSYLIQWLRARRDYQVPQDGWPWRIRPPIRPVPLGDWLLSGEA